MPLTSRRSKDRSVAFIRPKTISTKRRLFILTEFDSNTHRRVILAEYDNNTHRRSIILTEFANGNRHGSYSQPWESLYILTSVPNTGISYWLNLTVTLTGALYWLNMTTGPADREINNSTRHTSFQNRRLLLEGTVHSFHSFRPILDFLHVLESQGDCEENTLNKTKIGETVDVNVKLSQRRKFKKTGL